MSIITTYNPDDQISRLLLDHALSKLRLYEGNLSYAVHIVERGWLPEIDAPEMAENLEKLRQYLATTGHAESDPFLLRLGLTIPGMQRGIVPPLLVLQSNRGGFSSRRQQEAARHIQRLHEALAIGRGFLPHLDVDFQKAIVDLAELAQRRKLSDADWLAAFENLSDEQADKLATRALDCLQHGEKSISEVGLQVLQRLACFRHAPLAEKHGLMLIDRAVFWPSCLYRESGERVALRLAGLIERKTDGPSLIQLLLALAWTRSATAELAFRDWTRYPPNWAKSLPLPSVEYLPSAGWRLDEHGQRQELVSTHCFRLRPSDDETGVIHARTLIDTRCPSCGSRLVNLFDFSQSNIELENVELPKAPVTVLCCLDCARFGPVFARYFANESAEFLSSSYDGESLRACETPAGSRNLAAVLCPRFACAEPYSLEDATTLGGVPMWLQDAEYPHCLECGRHMTFLAQHDNGPLGEEGIYYAFYCASCHVSAVGYQQT